ncbi:MAG: hypothetical protein K5686_00010 [Lachnospiraceae bacterium]|nr:hypothetical protein [Lachnospiraceae bacterium]
MLKYKCGNCGGEFEIHAHGELLCPFCGTKQYFSDAELSGYKGYRDNVLQYVRRSNDSFFAKGDVLRLFNDSDIEKYESADGSIEIAYTYRTETDGVEIFINKESVVCVFPADRSSLADRALKNIAELEYPSADIKNLRNCLPYLKARYELKSGGVILAFSKNENVYPLFIFSELHPKHVAWIISRMENLCCLLEFNGLDHKHMDEQSLFINPKSHEAFWYGGWWDTEGDGPRTALADIRKTAKKLTGEMVSEGPREYAEFLSSKPRDTAYDDFAYWDEVIEKGFGGHHFADFEG